MSRLRTYVARHHVALLALFVALGGTSYAAANLPKNSVGTKQLKAKAVTTKKMRRGAVTSSLVRDGSLVQQDFAPGTLLKGPKGDKGTPGQNGPQSVLVREGAGVNVPAATGGAPGIVSAYATCGAGERAVGGGGQPDNDGDSTGSVELVASKPQPQTTGSVPNSWAIRVANYRPSTTTLYAYAICIK